MDRIPPPLTDLAAFAPFMAVSAPQRMVAPVIFNSPHSGQVYPADFLAMARLDLATLRSSEDSFVDELFAGVVGAGMMLVSANFPRCFVDLNREPYELDPRMFDSRLPSYVNSRSMRVAAGLGTVARLVGDQKEIYRHRLSVEEALNRIEGLYKPYHRTLRRHMVEAQRRFGSALLVDCHSMPASALSREEREKGDIVLGDRYGTSCSAEVTNFIETFLVSRGYRVLRNRPYAGGFITEHYGSPNSGAHAIQIEINRALYLEERSYRKKRGFSALQADMTELARAIAVALFAGEEDVRFAAE